MSAAETKTVAPKATKAKKTVAKKAKKSEASSATMKSVSRFASTVLLEPLVTEKTARLSSSGVLVFRVASSATRVGIKQAVKELYGVIPAKVNVVTVRPRAVRFGRTLGKTKGYKKAMITLPEGKTIDVFAA